jgi:hypothetical protein
MANQTNVYDISLPEKTDVNQTKAVGTNALPEWVEKTSSYLDDVRASLAALTEADKEAIHLSLQEKTAV